MAKLAIGIDVGATNFRLGVVSGEGKILEKYSARVGPKRGPADIVGLLAARVEKLKSNWPEVIGVGIGFPGIVDFEKEIVYQAPHYPGWVEVDLKKLLFEAFGMSVWLDNDANIVALGEGWQGAGRGLDNFLMVTLGTGIGGGIVCGGDIWRGDNGFAGEIGHTLINFGGPKCECGSRGCWEMYASATGLKYLVENSHEPDKKKLSAAIENDYDRLTPALLHDLAKDGNIFASVIWKKFGAYLGAGMASLVNTLGIMNIVIGGGISRAWDFFITEAEKELGRRTYKKTAEMVRLNKACLGDDAGVLGSAKIVFQLTG